MGKDTLRCFLCIIDVIAMSAPPSGSGPLSDEDDLGDLDDPGNFDDPEDPSDVDPSGEPASDPESAREEAEDALAEIEALADLDEDPEPDAESTETESSGGGAQARAETETAEAEAGSSTAEAGTETPDEKCANCGAPLHGDYCSACGQKDAERIVPFWHMLNDALEAIFQLDLRVFRTLPKFLFLPGRLTKEYISGRRKRYVRPFRLFLVSTFLLFAVIAFTTTGSLDLILDPQGTTRLNPPNTALRASISARPDTTISERISRDSAATVGTTPTADTTSKRDDSMFGDPEVRKKYANHLRSDSSSLQLKLDLYDDPEANERLERVLRAKVAQALENPWDAVGSMIDRGPYLMFLLLPIFAFLMKLLYVRRGRYYIEHLIFSLHVHALAFVAFTVGILFDQSSVGWLNTTAPWVEASPFLYLILAMRHVYEQGIIKSSIKAFILLSIYSIVLSIGFLALLVLSVLFM